MSDTPRTDAAARKGSDLGLANAWASGIWNLARELERELSAVTRERDEAHANVEDADREIAKLTRERDEARLHADAEAGMCDLVAKERDALRASIAARAEGGT